MLFKLSVDYRRWKRRYKSLKSSNNIIREQMTTWAKKQKPRPKKGKAAPEWLAYSRVKTFVSIMRSLDEFSSKQFELLHGGFKNGKLEAVGSLPPEYVLRRFMDQDAHDVMLLQMAWNQRISAEIDSESAQTLRLADKLAYMSVERAHAHGILPDESTAITYLQKAASARVVPYAPTAIIGIPYASVAAYEDDSADIDACIDLLAIPHEVGHYIYRHGRYDGNAIRSHVVGSLNGNNAALAGWVEEIFSDVYGTLIAGPVIALDFQDLISDNNPTDLFHADGAHPYGAVRPLIYVDTLLAMDAIMREHDIPNRFDLRPSAHLLELRWRTILADRGYAYESLDFLHRDRARIAGVIRILLNDLVDVDTVSFDQLWSTGEAVRNAFQEKLGGVPSTLTELWQELENSSDDLRDEVLQAHYVYDAFGDWLKSAELTPPPELVMVDKQPRPVMRLCPSKTDIIWKSTDLVGVVKIWDFLTDQMLDATRKGKPFAGEKVPANLWSQIAIQSGWIKLDPETGDGPKLGPETGDGPKLGPETGDGPKLGPETGDGPKLGPETGDGPKLGPETGDGPKLGPETGDGPKLG